MTTPTDRVRAALEDIVHAAFEHGNKCLSGKTLDPDGELLGAAKEALRELDGMVLVPVGLIHKTKALINFHVKRGACIDIDDKLFNEGEIYAELNRAMIAPYAEGEKE